MNGPRFMRPGFALLAFFLCLALRMPCSSGSLGLSTPFIDVTVANLFPGKTVRISEAGYERYSLRNRGTSKVEVSVAVHPPPPLETAAGFEPIPDASWVLIEPNRLSINPGETGYAEISIAIPNESKWKGKKFHSRIVANTTNANHFVSASVSSHLKFTISKTLPKPSKK